MKQVVGVLALQGAYDKHMTMLSSMGVESCKVRFPHELEDCCALIIPGGESTTMSLLIQQSDLYAALQHFAEQHPVMGVCAGAILMADSVGDHRVTPLNIMQVNIERNYFGRQLQSFSTELQLACDFEGQAYHAHFIRAPELVSRDENIEVLASYKNQSVLLRQGRHMMMSFHPELTDDDRVHRCWLQSFYSQLQ